MLIPCKCALSGEGPFLWNDFPLPPLTLPKLSLKSECRRAAETRETKQIFYVIHDLIETHSTLFLTDPRLINSFLRQLFDAIWVIASNHTWLTPDALLIMQKYLVSCSSSLHASVYPQKNVPLSIDFSSITISDIHTNHIHSLSMNLQPGEITYLVGKGLYEYDFLNAIFGEVPRFRINLGNKDFINAKISTLFYAGIGYFPQDVSRLIFPDLNYFENTTIFSLRRISYLGTVVRSAFQNYLLTKQPFSYKEDPKYPFYKINYENRIVAAANRYALYNWRLLIIHLPNINPTGVESRIFQTLIDDLANRGTSVLVVVAASSEILTGADNLFEFDQEGNCYQKLDHQNHRLQK